MGSVCLLVATISCTLLSSYFFHKINFAYEDNCLLYAKLKIIQNYSPDVLTYSSANAWASSASDESIEPLPQEEIDPKLTYWGDSNYCDWALHLPLFECCFGIIMLTFVIITGRGGRADNKKMQLIERPWRIVIPSIIFYLCMLVMSIVQIVFVHGGFKAFCNDLNVTACESAIDNFILLPVTYKPSLYYHLLHLFNWLVFSMWIILITVMIARIIFIVDFQLIRVTVKTYEYENTNQNTAFKTKEMEVDNDRDGREITTEC